MGRSDGREMREKRNISVVIYMYINTFGGYKIEDTKLEVLITLKKNVKITRKCELLKL